MNKEFSRLNVAGETYEVKDSKARKKLANLYFNNVSDMKNSNSLSVGDIVKTLGYYNVGDGGAALYTIRTKLTTDIEDNGSIHFIGNNLVAELIVDKLSIDQFGAKGDGVSDDSTCLMNAIKFAISKKVKLHIGSKTYYMADVIELNNIENMMYDFCFHITGFNKIVSKIVFNKNLEYGFKYTGTELKNFIFENLSLETNKTDVTTSPSNIRMLHLENSPYSIFRNVNIRGCMYGIYQTNCWCSKYIEMNLYYCGYGIYVDGYEYTVGFGDNLLFEKINMGQQPVYSGIYLKGCVNVKMIDLTAETSTKGNAITIDSCKNVLIDNFYTEFWLNQNPILIKATDFTSLDRIPSGITINNINAYNTVALVRVEACLSAEINNAFYRNRIYNENIPAFEDYPLLISFKEANSKYIGLVKVNGTNFIRPVGSGTLPAAFTEYNGLLKCGSGYNYYCRTFMQGTKIFNPADNILKTIIEDGTFSANPTALISYAQNNFFGTLNQNDANLFVGQYVTIGSQKLRVIKIDGLTVYFDSRFNKNGADEAITTCNPKFIDEKITV